MAYSISSVHTSICTYDMLLCSRYEPVQLLVTIMIKTTCELQCLKCFIRPNKICTLTTHDGFGPSLTAISFTEYFEIVNFLLNRTCRTSRTNPAPGECLVVSLHKH